MAARIDYSTDLRWSLIRSLVTTLAFGLNFIVASPNRFHAPAFGMLREVAPMPFWGFIFLCSFVGIAIGLYTRRREVTINSLVAAVGVHSFISLGYTIQAVRDPGASFTGALAFAVIAWSIGGTAFAVSRSRRVDR